MMDKKVTGIVAYITVIGWVIALLAGDKEGAKFHLNQALVLYIVNLVLVILGRIPIIGIVAGLLGIVTLVLWIIGLVHAINEEEKPLPIIGGIQILK